MTQNTYNWFFHKIHKHISISYAVTVCNESVELEKLLGILVNYAESTDEIIVLSDHSNVTAEVLEVISRYQHKYPITHISHPLGGDFATFKNKLISSASKHYLFQIDADEFPNKKLLENLKTYLLLHFYADCFYVPRVNTVDGINEDYIQKWNWKTDPKGRINFPDYQMRIFKLGKNIKWVNKVHERLINYRFRNKLPSKNEDYCLFHPKTIIRQEKQNAFYDTLI